MARVVISHASEDRAWADQVLGWLKDEHHDVFLDHALREGFAVGEGWQQRLYERLRGADAVVCLVTSAYGKSIWCTVEITYASVHGSWLLPVRVEAGADHPLLEPWQYTDAESPETARVALVEALRRLDAAGGRGWEDGRNPFPGLRALDTDQHRAFFGRHHETQQLAGAVRSSAERTERPVLLVVGPSGCGKSSLVRAGLLPVMGADERWWVLPAFVPGTDPVAALARAMVGAARDLGLDWTFPHVHEELTAEGTAALVEELLAAVSGRKRPRRLLVVVDQAEELLRTPGPRRARFATVLGALLGGSASVAATVRPDFLPQLLADPELANLPIQPFTLRPLGKEVLREVVDGPAALAGIEVERGLATRLVDDTESGHALPLLAYTLERLAAGVRRGGELSHARYDELGGVRGALISQAEDALADAVARGHRTENDVVTGLLRLVAVDEHGHPTRLRVRQDELPAPVRVELDAFVERRLLSTDSENGAVVLAVAHEAFLAEWPPLVEAITPSAPALRARTQVEQAAVEWDSAGRPNARLWDGGALAAAIHDLGTGRQVDLSARGRAFLRAGMRRDRLRRTRAVTVLSTFLALALVAAGYAVLKKVEAEAQQRSATARQLVAQADAAQLGDPRTALLLGLAARQIQPGGETQAGLVDTLTSTHHAGTVAAHAGPVNVVAFTADGRIFATGGQDGNVVLWAAPGEGGPRRIGSPLPGRAGPVLSLAFSRDGRTLAMGSAEGNVVWWDVSDRARPARLGQSQAGGTEPVTTVAFGPDGQVFATGGEAGTVTLWDVTHRSAPMLLERPPAGVADAVYAMAFAPDGRTFATAGLNGDVVLWAVSGRAAPRALGAPLPGYGGPIYTVAFAPSGRMVATGDDQGAVVLWDVADRARPRVIGSPLTSRTGAVDTVAFAPDGRSLATGDDQGAVVLWDVSDPAEPVLRWQSRTGAAGRVWATAFTPDGRTLVTGGADGAVVLWDVPDRARPRVVGQPLRGHTSSVLAAAYARDGRTLATGGGDGAVLLWDVSDPAGARAVGPPLRAHHGAVHAVGFAPDGRTLATGGEDGTVVLWDVSDPAGAHAFGPALRAHHGAVRTVAFARGGRTLATGGADGTVVLWDAADRRQPRAVEPPLRAHTGQVRTMAFARDGRTLATGGGDGLVTLWNVSAPAVPRVLGRRLRAHSGSADEVVFAPDGQTLATGGDDGAVRLWDVADPARARSLGQPLAHAPDLVDAVAFAPDGRTLAVGHGPEAGGEGSVVLWDVSDRSAPRVLGRPLTGHDSAFAVAFSPDGRTLATGGGDRTVVLWDLSALTELRAHAVDHACRITGRGLDRAEWDRYIPGLPYRDTCPR